MAIQYNFDPNLREILQLRTDTAIILDHLTRDMTQLEIAEFNAARNNLLEENLRLHVPRIFRLPENTTLSKAKQPLLESRIILQEGFQPVLVLGIGGVVKRDILLMAVPLSSDEGNTSTVYFMPKKFRHKNVFPIGGRHRKEISFRIEADTSPVLLSGGNRETNLIPEVVDLNTGSMQQTIGKNSALIIEFRGRFFEWTQGVEGKLPGVNK